MTAAHRRQYELPAPASSASRRRSCARLGKRRCRSSSSWSGCSGSCRRSGCSSRRSCPRRLRHGGLVEDLLQAEPRDLVELRRDLPQPGPDHARAEDDRLHRDRQHGARRSSSAALAGYAFAWLEFPGRDWLFIVVIALLVVPLQMALIPMFRLYDTFGLYDTVFGMILFHTAFGLPFAIFLLRNFFIGIPKDILESARIDGASARSGSSCG